MNGPSNSLPSGLAGAGERGSLGDRVRSLRITDRPMAQPVGRWWLPWVLCLLFAAAAVALAMRSPPPPAPQTTGEPAEKGQGTYVSGQDKEVAFGFGPNKALGADAILLDSKGYVMPFQTIKVSPKVAATVLKLNIKEGQQVKKGDILAELEKIEYESRFLKIKGLLAAAGHRHLELDNGSRPQEIKQAKAELDEAKSQLDFAMSEWQRNQKLSAKVGTLSSKELEQSQSDFKVWSEKVKKLQLSYELMVEGPRQEKIDAAAAEVTQLEADFAEAKWRLDNCTVRAPISGTILSKKAEEGDSVNPNAFNVSASLCELADLYDLEVDLAIAERDISKVFQGQKCKVRPEAFPSRSYWGAVSRLMPTADRAKGTITVRVKVLITWRPEDIKPGSATAAIGLLTTPFAGGLVGPSGLAASVVEPQGEYLRPEMGALVTFFNARMDLD